jgi:Ran GTPase-activating protein (RanGAP) involved in mRNA processing and transport
MILNHFLVHSSHKLVIVLSFQIKNYATMEEHDHDYYEARAQTINLKSITSDEYNAEILRMLRDDDTDLSTLFIEDSPEDECDFVVREGDDMGWLGFFVGRCKVLKSLYIHHMPESTDRIASFIRGFIYNRSIQGLHINTDIGEEDFRRMGHFFRNNKTLNELEIKFVEIGVESARGIAFMLGQCEHDSLKKIRFEEVIIGDESMAKIATALRAHRQLEELSFEENLGMGEKSCVALGRTLEGCCNPNLNELMLSNSDIDDEGVKALVAGMRNCCKLSHLDMQGNHLITETGLRALSTLFQSDRCYLEWLDLSHMNIGDDGARALVSGLAGLQSLDTLRLSYNSIGDDGLCALAAGIASLRSLKKLHLDGNSAIGDEGSQAIVAGLAKCFNLETLRLSECSLFGLRSLGSLSQRTSALRELCLCNSSIDDEGLKLLVEGTANHFNIAKLDLSRNEFITSAGLKSLSSLFQCKCCHLEILALRGINFSDKMASALADGLKGNASVRHLYFDATGVTALGWAVFARLVCDTSSISHTYLSNYTLQEVGNYFSYSAPEDMRRKLDLNREGRKYATICKILKSHREFDIEPMFKWKLKLLPLVVAWFSEARLYRGYVKESVVTFQCRELNAAYKFVHGMPLLTIDGYRSQNRTGNQSKKRKLDHHVK